MDQSASEVYRNFRVSMEQVRAEVWKCEVVENPSSGISGTRRRMASATYQSREAAVVGARTLIDWFESQEMGICFYCGSPIDQEDSHVRAWIRHNFELGSTGESAWNFHSPCFVMFRQDERTRSPSMRYDVLESVTVSRKGE